MSTQMPSMCAPFGCAGSGVAQARTSAGSDGGRSPAKAVMGALIMLLAVGLSACTESPGPATFSPPGGNVPDAGGSATVATSATFEVQGWEVVSEVDSRHQLPRAYLKVDFVAGGPVSLSLIDPAGLTTDLGQQFGAGTATARLPMTLSFMETPAPGHYVLNVSTWYGAPVTDVGLTFTGTELSVTGATFTAGDGVERATLDVGVVNYGDLPAYVSGAQVWIARTHPTVSVESYTVLPGESVSVAFHWYMDEALPAGLPREPAIRLTDGAGMPVAEYGNPPDIGPASGSVRVRSWGLEDRADPMLDVPRPYLILSLELETPVYLTLIGPDGQQTAPAAFVTQESITLALPMAPSAEETPKPGQYRLRITRWIGDDPVLLDVAEFEGVDLSVTGMSLVVGGGQIPSTLAVDVRNDGDLPVHVIGVDLAIDGVPETVPAQTTEVQPGEAATLTYRWVPQGAPPDTSAPSVLEVDLKDRAGATVAAYVTRLQLDVLLTFASQTLPYAIAYPDTWTVTEEDLPGGSQVTVEHPQGQARVVIEARRLPGQTVDQWVNARLAARRGEWWVYELLSDESVIWHDLPARRLSWLGRETISDKLEQVTELCLASGDWRYSVRAVALESDHADFAAQLESILGRFSVFPQ